jgi:protein phosphatase
MPYDFRFRVDPGRIRHNNEDAVLVDTARGLAVLADGMGGYNAGEVASGMATTLLARELALRLDEAALPLRVQDTMQALEGAAHAVNRAIFDAAQAHPACSGMGTTLLVAVFQPQRLVLGHVGDSRAYRWRRGELTQITRDHSLLQEQLDAGLITPRQAAVSIHRNLVTRAVGVQDSVRIEVHAHAVEPGDCYLLCSDGLSDMVDDASLASILACRLTLQDKAQALIDSANARGGRDNIAVVLVQALRPRAWWRRLRPRWPGGA